MLEIKHNGMTLFLNGFLIDDFYSGILEGRTHFGYVSNTNFDTMKWVPKIWGDSNRAVFVKKPLTPRIPKITYKAWLTNYEPVNDEKYHGSDLVIVWFSDKIVGTVEEIIREGLKDIDWKKHAGDYWF